MNEELDKDEKRVRYGEWYYAITGKTIRPLDDESAYQLESGANRGVERYEDIYMAETEGIILKIRRRLARLAHLTDLIRRNSAHAGIRDGMGVYGSDKSSQFGTRWPK